MKAHAIPVSPAVERPARRGLRFGWCGVAALALPFLASCFGATEADPAEGGAGRPRARRISAEEARQRMDEPRTIVLDVRTPGEFAGGHIPGALLIPLAELRPRASRELPDPSAPILVYCRTGSRSAVAARQLAGMGYTDVSDFGGIIRWRGETVRGR